MKFFRRTLIILVPVLALGACTTLSDQDRALLTSASQNAEQAKTTSQQALDASRAAQASAQKAEEEAAAANEKADRMFRHSLRKVSPSK